MLVMAAVPWLGPALAWGQSKAPDREAAELSGRRWAMLIGVDEYKRLDALRYCGEDARALGERLVQSGFQRDRVIVLRSRTEKLDEQPLKDNIEGQLKLVLSSAKEADLVVLSFSGHGVRLGGRSYLCPYEADLENPATLVSLDSVFKRLEECPAALKVFIVDACQNNVLQRGVRSGQGSQMVGDFAKDLGEVPTPRGILLLTSCAPGEKSREAPELKHGVFMHFMLEGLTGQADSNHNGVVTLSELFAYTSDRTQDYVRLKCRGLQRPALRGAIVDFPLIVVPEGKPPAPEPPEPEPVPPEARTTTSFSDSLAPFGEVPEGWKQCGEITNKSFEIGRPKTYTSGDFTLSWSVTTTKKDRNGFRITLVGANGGSDLALEGGKTNSWSGTDDWSFKTPKGQPRKGVIPGTRTFTLQRKGKVFTLSVDQVFNPQSHDTTIETFVIEKAGDFQGLRIATDGPGITAVSASLK
jgi:hypothetical protein